MKEVRVHKNGGPAVLQYEDAPRAAAMIDTAEISSSQRALIHGVAGGVTSNAQRTKRNQGFYFEQN